MTAGLYVLTLAVLCVSFYKDKAKTFTALRKAWKSFENIMPQFLGVLILTGVLIAVLNPQMISRIIGSESGWFGTVLAALVGALTLIPGFVAFPTASLLLQNGAGYMQIAAFVSALMMVGIVTFPVEISYFGKKAAILRNLLAFIMTFLVAAIIAWVHAW